MVAHVASFGGLGVRSVCPLLRSRIRVVTDANPAFSIVAVDRDRGSAAPCSRGTSPSGRSCRGRRRASAPSRRRPPGSRVYGRRRWPSSKVGSARRRRSSRCSPAIPRASRGSSAWSRPTGAASFTGAECLAWAGHRTGDGYAVQGNILAGEAVVVEMERRVPRDGRLLAERLVTALGPARPPAATRAGSSRGDRRRTRGAASESREGIDRVCELRVEDHPAPIAELRRLLGIHLVWDSLRRATHVPRARSGTPRAPRSCARPSTARGEDAVLLYDLACFESLAGDTEAALGHITRALELDAGLRQEPPPTPTSTRSGGPAVRSARQLGSPAAWISTSTRARSSSGAPASPSRRGGWRHPGGGARRGRGARRPGRRQGAGADRRPRQGRRDQARRRPGRGGGAREGDPRPRHPRPRRAQALDREGLGHREGVLPLGHLRPRREAAAVHVHDAGRRGHRGGRGDAPGRARPPARRPVRGLPALAGARG